MHAKSLWLCPTPCDHMDCSSPGSSVHGDSPSKNSGVVCHALLQGIFSTQGNDLLLAVYFILILDYGNNVRQKANSSDFLI